MRVAFVSKSPLAGFLLDFFHIAEQDEVGDSVSQNLVGGFERALFSSFGQHNALLVCLGTLDELFN